MQAIKITQTHFYSEDNDNIKFNTNSNVFLHANQQT